MRTSIFENELECILHTLEFYFERTTGKERKKNSHRQAVLLYNRMIRRSNYLHLLSVAEKELITLSESTPTCDHSTGGYCKACGATCHRECGYSEFCMKTLTFLK